MIKLLKNANLFAPSAYGIVDILIADSKIAHIGSNIDMSSNQVEVIDLEGRTVIPGLVDTLAHVTGGGGESGFGSRTPAITPDQIIASGVTSLVGALGTDSVTRSLQDLYGKTQELRSAGLNAYMHSGSYHYPAKTLTSSVQEDLMMIEPVIGVGEIAISDHRGSHPTSNQLAHLASDVKVGAMIAGKQGVVSVHVGDAPQGIDPLFHAIHDYALNPSVFYPTHISRNNELLEQGKQFTKIGGYIDITTSTNEGIIAQGEMPPADAVCHLLDSDVDNTKITLSSDAQGSLPNYNKKNELIGLDIGAIDSLYSTMCALIEGKQIDPSMAIRLVTENPAKAVGINAGSLFAGASADLVVLDSWSCIDSVMSNGQWLMRQKNFCFNTPFEDSLND